MTSELDFTAATPATPRTYPWIGVDDRYETMRFVVLFYSARCGVVIARENSSSYVLGYHSNMWNIAEFTQFHGTVKLTENKP